MTELKRSRVTASSHFGSPGTNVNLWDESPLYVRSVNTGIVNTNINRKQGRTVRERPKAVALRPVCRRQKLASRASGREDKTIRQQTETADFEQSQVTLMAFFKSIYF